LINHFNQHHGISFENLEDVFRKETNSSDIQKRLDELNSKNCKCSFNINPSDSNKVKSILNLDPIELPVINFNGLF